MKAIQFKTFGSPDVLEYVDLPTPQADAESAVVQVKSASVNPSDVKNVSGHFEHTVLPRTPGRDFSGVSWTVRQNGSAPRCGAPAAISASRATARMPQFIKIPARARCRANPPR